MIYVDTSVLFSLYVPDTNSTRADAWRQANPEPIEDIYAVQLQ
jgi:predicted nucleic acid-binding protein